MITFETALNTMIATAKTLGTESCLYMDSVGKVLAEDIFSDINMPPFDKSAMDGYACRQEDLGNELKVIEVIPAGIYPSKKVGPNTCSKIMTGAPVPEGADTVIMVEHTENSSEDTIRYTKDKSKSNICYLAEDVKTGDLVIKKGTCIEPKHIPILASVGAVNIEVYKSPKLAVVSTGDELVEPEVIPKPSQIRNSNAYQMLAQAKALGIEVEYIGIALDTKESTQEMLLKAIDSSDIIIMSGAVSMGDFDFVPIVLKENNIDIHFHGVAVKPGKRTVFGTNSDKWFIGVPGNPVSAFVQFEMLIKPLIQNIMGHSAKAFSYKLPLAESFKRRKAGRMAFEPVIINEDGAVEFVEYHGSAHIHAISDAQALMVVEADRTEINKGELVHVRPI